MRDVKFGAQVGLGFIGKITSMAVAFVGSIVIARAVGPEIFGMYFLFLSIASLIDNPITGWGQAARKRLTQQDFSNSEAAGAAYLSFAAILPIGVGTGLVIHQTEMLAVPDIGAVLIPLMFVATSSYTVAKELLNGTVRFGSANWVNAFRDLLRVGLQVGFVLAGFSLAGMVGGFTIATISMTPLIHRLVGISLEIPSWDTIRSVWSFARHSVPRRLLGTALTRMDILLLGFVTATSAAGHYQAAWNLTTPATLLSGVAAPGMMSRVSALSSDGDIEEVSTHVQRAINFASIIAIPIFGGAAVFGTETVVLIYDSEYSEAGLFLVGIAAFQVLKTQTSIYTSVLEGIDRPDLTLRYSLLQFVVNLALGVVLLFSIGLVGVIIATVVAKLLHYLLTMWAVREHISVNPIGEPLRDQIIAAILMTIVVGILMGSVKPGDTLNTIAVLVAGATIYGGALLWSSHHRHLAISLFNDFLETVSRPLL